MKSSKAKNTKSKSKNGKKGGERAQPQSVPPGTSFADIVLSTIQLVPISKRIGKEKVFIIDLFEEIGKRWKILPAPTLDGFKQWLTRANRDRIVSLSRADAVGAMDPRKVAESEIEHLGASFHFVLDESQVPGYQGRFNPGNDTGVTNKKQLDREIKQFKQIINAGLTPEEPKQMRSGSGGLVYSHPKTHAGCKTCGQFHSTAEHEKHERLRDPNYVPGRSKSSAKASKSKSTGSPKKSSAGASKRPRAKAKSTKTASKKKSDPAIPPPGSSIADLVLRTIPHVGPEGRFGANKIFISELFDKLKEEWHLPDFTLSQFKKWLVEANRDQIIDLARADIVGAMDPRKVKESAIESYGAIFNFVIDRNKTSFD